MISGDKRLCDFCGNTIHQGASFIATLIHGRRGNSDADYTHYHRERNREADAEPDCYEKHCHERHIAKRAA